MTVAQIMASEERRKERRSALEEEARALRSDLQFFYANWYGADTPIQMARRNMILKSSAMIAALLKEMERRDQGETPQG